jgi:hypothetical protein
MLFHVNWAENVFSCTLSQAVAEPEIYSTIWKQPSPAMRMESYYMSFPWMWSLTASGAMPAGKPHVIFGFEARFQDLSKEGSAVPHVRHGARLALWTPQRRRTDSRDPCDHWSAYGGFHPCRSESWGK